MASTFSYKELNLLLFALTGDNEAGTGPETEPSCESACPIVDEVDHLLNGRMLSGRDRLVRHLNNHLREGLIESGMFEHLATSGASPTGAGELRMINQRLAHWSCQIDLDSTDRGELSSSLSRLPGSAWISMPLTMWRLRQKLRNKS